MGAYTSQKDQAISNLIFILGDQLSLDIAALKKGNEDEDIVLMVEVVDEASYVPHHKKKIAFLFSAMRHFAEELRREGWTVDYVSLSDKNNSGSFEGELKRAVERHIPLQIFVTEPGEWRVLESLKNFQTENDIPLAILTDDRFIATHQEFREWAEGRKQLRMEYFYREMRRKTGLLMNGDQPEGGKWNYDAENRKPAKAYLFMPQPHQVKPDAITQEVLDLVGDKFSDNFGDLTPFWFAVTRNEAEKALDVFIRDALPKFGDYQDAMLKDEKFLYHSILSLYINCGLLDPLSVCHRVAQSYHDGYAPLNAAEGFIRQIIGWREYVRGIYWLKMPDYVSENYLGAKRKLPSFYWSGETDMACLKAAISQTKEEAYAHHIQRLMVTGNFALLAGVDPHEVHEWYLAVYADAYEWVELPNTLGMSQFGDGGVLGSKPYISSGNYINKMSDYCKGCKFDVKKKYGEGACPFNSLYWDFLARHADKFRGNPRMGQMYRLWDKMHPEKQQAYRDSAAVFLASLD